MVTPVVTTVMMSVAAQKVKDSADAAANDAVWNGSKEEAKSVVLLATQRPEMTFFGCFSLGNASLGAACLQCLTFLVILSQFFHAEGGFKGQPSFD